MITVSSLAATYSSAVTYNAATGTTTTSDASASATGASTTANPNGKLSQAVTDKVTQALAPATAGIKQLNTSLTQGQTKLSALGQVQSAIADFQTLAKNLSSTDTSSTSGTTATDMTTKVKSFVTAYNALNTKLQTLQSGDLKADPGLAQVSAQMTQALRDAGGTSSTGALGKAGISLSGGKLTIDATKLSAALAADPSGVASMLTGGNGVADKLSSKLAALTTAGGAIGRETATTTKQISSIETQRVSMTKVLTSTATALAAMYTQQEQAGTSSSGATSLFDMMG